MGPPIVIRNDLTLSDLESRIITPYKSNRMFTVSGIIITDSIEIQDLQCFQTDEPLEALVKRNPMPHGDARLLPMEFGTDYSRDLLGEASAQPLDHTLLIRACQNFRRCADLLKNRSREREPFVINDEYDAQDLLAGILRAYFPDLDRENPIPRTGGTSSRADLTIASLGVIVELKFARPGSQGMLRSQFADDYDHYANWPGLRLFVYLVCNANALPDRHLMLQLNGEYSVRGNTFSARVILDD